MVPKGRRCSGRARQLDSDVGDSLSKLPVPVNHIRHTYVKSPSVSIMAAPQPHSPGVVRRTRIHVHKKLFVHGNRLCTEI